MKSMKRLIAGLLVTLLGFQGVVFAQPLGTTTPASTQKSTVGDYYGINSFGYRDGMLISRPYFGQAKTVDMGEQMVTLPYKCTGFIVGTKHVPTVEVVAAVNPSLLWETEYHRLVAIYAALSTFGNGGSLGDRNIVTKADMKAGVTNYIGQWQERFCAEVGKKTLRDLIANSSFGYADVLNGLVKADARSPFEVKVQTVKVIGLEELTRSLALEALDTRPKAPGPAKPKAITPICPCACTPVCAPSP